MAEKTSKKESKKIEIDTTGLTDGQIRLLKSANALLTHVMQAEFEDEYFDSSSELFRVIATAIKTSQFNKSSDEIAYDKQVLEFCSDILADQVYGDDVIQYDN